MNKFVAGMLAGGAIIMAGAEMMSMNNCPRKKIMRKGRKIMDKAEDVIEDIGNEIW